MKKFLFLIFCIVGLLYLSHKNIFSPLKQIESFINLHASKSNINNVIQVMKPLQKQEKIFIQHAPKSMLKNGSPSPVIKDSNGKYPPQAIQTYLVSVKNGKLVISGKPTPYGKYYNADGVILDIQEQRSNTRTTIKVPFTDGEIHYEYPLHYQVGEVILNLNEYYNGKPTDPNKVLGYAVYHLTDGDPYLLPSYMVQSNNPNLVALARSITNGKKTDIEKSRAIFEWVAKHIAYNAPLVNSKNPPIYSALKTYQTRVVLCSGYADLSAALHRAVGIETKVMYGDNHAWNQVKLNGTWQSEDPTYGSGFIDLNTGKFVRSYHPAYFYKTDMHVEGEYPW